MYLHQLKDAFNEGNKKIRRLAWPAGKFIMKAKPIGAFELDESECKAIGVPEKTVATPSSECVLCVENKKVTIGYEFNHDDKISQDWELVK